MKITSIPDKTLSIHDFVSVFKDRVEESEDNDIADEFDEGYMSGYHDAIIEVFDFFGIKHDQDYYD